MKMENLHLLLLWNRVNHNPDFARIKENKQVAEILDNAWCKQVFVDIDAHC